MCLLCYVLWIAWRGVSSLCCGELLVSSLSFVTPPYHTFLLLCAAALGARVHRRGNIDRGHCNSNHLDTNPSLYIDAHRGSFFTSFFPVFFAKIADDRQQTTCEEPNATDRTMCACRIFSLRRRVPFVIACHVLLTSCALSFSIRALCTIFYSKPNPTPHVPLFASWRSLSWKSKCDALLEIIHIICVKVLCAVTRCCVYFSATDRSSAHLYRVSKKCSEHCCFCM